MEDFLPLAEALRDFYHRSQRLLDARMRAHGVSFAGLKLLLFIESGTAVRSTDIASALGFSPRTVTDAIDALEREGLISRVADPNDRRVKHIRLTGAGQAVIVEALPLRQLFLEQLFGTLGDGDARALSRLMDSLNMRLKQLASADAG